MEFLKKTLNKDSLSKETKTMEGTWKVDGVFVITENEAQKKIKFPLRKNNVMQLTKAVFGY